MTNIRLLFVLPTHSTYTNEMYPSYHFPSRVFHLEHKVDGASARDHLLQEYAALVHSTEVGLQ